uniref:Uncharacterized protein n=1 Tax=Guillardia theta TaxID=55529 RepID=A0A7S4N4V5_GUITH
MIRSCLFASACIMSNQPNSELKTCKLCKRKQLFHHVCASVVAQAGEVNHCGRCDKPAPEKESRPLKRRRKCGVMPNQSWTYSKIQAGDRWRVISTGKLSMIWRPSGSISAPKEMTHIVSLPCLTCPNPPRLTRWAPYPPQAAPI